MWLIHHHISFGRVEFGSTAPTHILCVGIEVRVAVMQWKVGHHLSLLRHLSKDSMTHLGDAESVSAHSKGIAEFVARLVVKVAYVPVIRNRIIKLEGGVIGLMDIQVRIDDLVLLVLLISDIGRQVDIPDKLAGTYGVTLGIDTLVVLVFLKERAVIGDIDSLYPQSGNVRTTA